MSYATNSLGLMKRSSRLGHESPISRKKSIRSERSMLRRKTRQTTEFSSVQRLESLSLSSREMHTCRHVGRIGIRSPPSGRCAESISLIAKANAPRMLSNAMTASVT